MDGTAAINHNIEALKRILAGLVSMAGLGCLSSPLAGEDGSARRGEAEPLAEPGEGSGSRPTLPRHLRLAILRLLRPAEAAARRLIIASARGLVVTLPPPRVRKPKPISAEPLLRRFGIAVVVSPATAGALTSPLSGLRGRSFDRASGSIVGREDRGDCEAIGDPGNIREASAGGHDAADPEVRAQGGRRMCLPLFDPLRRFRTRRRYVPAHAAPRILLPGLAAPHRLPPPPSPDDPVDATRLNQRLAALAAALDDLPEQAKRFVRWRARRDRERNSPAPGRIGRISALRPGRPPGGRLSRFDPSARHPRNIRDVDEILAHAHALALYALQTPTRHDQRD